jgi:hypothetical protein
MILPPAASVSAISLAATGGDPIQAFETGWMTRWAPDSAHLVFSSVITTQPTAIRAFTRSEGELGAAAFWRVDLEPTAVTPATWGAIKSAIE